MLCITTVSRSLMKFSLFGEIFSNTGIHRHHKLKIKADSVLFKFHFGKLIALQQWPNIQVSHHTGGSLLRVYRSSSGGVEIKWHHWTVSYTQLQQDTEVDGILFQQDSSPPHYRCRFTSFLDDTFPTSKLTEVDLSSGLHGHPTSHPLIFTDKVMFLPFHNPYGTCETESLMQ
jgi:hypothetical protein